MKTPKFDNRVGIVIDPKLKYPPFPYNSTKLSGALGSVLAQIGLDPTNPFVSLIKSGQVVVIKPNWVIDRNLSGSDINPLITHTSVIKLVIDGVVKALGGRGRIVLADAPVQACDFTNLLKKAGINRLINRYKRKYPKIDFGVIDLRKTVLKKDDQINAGGDPMGYSLIDLGKQSLLSDLIENYSKFRVTMYDRKMMEEHHNRVKNEYLISNTLLSADLVVNLAKMKCHVKAGLTGAMKNLVGINGHKEFLPHHMTGSSSEGGDQYIYRNKIREYYGRLYDNYWSSKKKIRFFGYLIDILGEISKIVGKDSLLDGGWFGNQTVPRMTIDINNIFYFYDLKRKKFLNRPVRKVINIVDGVVAGEGNGPLFPTAKKVGVLLAGFNPLLVDMAMGYLMGYRVLRMNTIFLAWRHVLSSFSGNYGVDILLNALPNLRFVKPKYWQILNR